MKLVLFISMGLTFFLGLGWLAVGPILHGSLITKKRDIPLLQQIPLILMSGIIINYGINLSFQSLRISLFVGFIFSIYGIGCFVRYIFRYQKQHIPISSSINKIIGITFLYLLFLSPILAIPLYGWDARSIWFFHAKMIYSAGSLGLSAGWQHPSIVFSHADYPKLIPVMAAQIAYIVGYWNEFIPKISLFFMLAPAILWLSTFARRSFSFIILLLTIISIFYMSVVSGYMDGILALNFSVSMLLLGRYINSFQRVDLLSTICCLISLLYIKNEGSLAGLIGFILILLLALFQGKKPSIPQFRVDWKYYLVGIIAFAPFVLWIIYKQRWHLSNDLGIGTIESFTRIISRFEDGSYKLVFHDAAQRIEGALLLFGTIYFASIAWRKTIAKESIPALLAAGIYFLAIIFIYLSTPYDLEWHLNTSLKRTMLSVNGCLFIGSYFVLNKIENHKITSLDFESDSFRDITNPR